jgi:secondary thiamine-phosphate synthase enzyme
MHVRTLTVETKGRGFTEISGELERAVVAAGAQRGLCNVFVHHTSASLLITENADPDVLADLETVFAGLAPDGDARYRHTAEGPDDMSAHVRSALTQTSLSVPVADGRPALGTWQGVFVWEHRARGHRRRVTITVIAG